MTLQLNNGVQWVRKDFRTVESSSVDGAEKVGDVVMMSVSRSDAGLSTDAVDISM